MPWPDRAWHRRLGLGLMTVLGLAERGFFIPHRYAANLPKAGTRAPYPAVEARLEAQRERFQRVLGWLDDMAEDLTRIGTEPPPAPRWSQDWFPRLDAAVAYALVRRLAPRRIIEVGAGHSTRFLARAARDGGLDCRITAVDPAPRAALAALDVELLRCTLQEAGTARFEALEPGDALFVDSSHVLMPGSDVDLLLGRVLPALRPGVLVHIHDIFLPDDYPVAWAWRGYNEQLGVLPLVLGDGWEVLFASHYVASRMAAAVARSIVAGLPLPAGAHESGLWLQKMQR